MKKRADGLWQRKIRIDGKDKVFYSSEPTEKKAAKLALLKSSGILGGLPENYI